MLCCPWANGSSVDVSFMYGVVLVLSEVGTVQENGYGIKDKIMLHCFRGAEWVSLQEFDIRYIMF